MLDLVRTKILDTHGASAEQRMIPTPSDPAEQPTFLNTEITGC